MTKSILYVLDFDGVICESTTECMVTSWNAWQRWNDSHEFRASPASFDDAEVEAFRRVRPRVRGAGEYYVVRRSLDEADEITDQSDYEERVSRSLPAIAAFKPIFMAQRDILRSNDLDNWLALHTSFPAVTAFTRRMAEESRLYIATLKDRVSVQAILSTLDIALPESRIVDESQVTSKLQALDLICRREDLEKREVMFVDDNATHLVDPHMHGYPVRQSTWGNVLPEGVEASVSAGIELVSQLDLTEWR